jgi:hypothetical protein
MTEKFDPRGPLFGYNRIQGFFRVGVRGGQAIKQKTGGQAIKQKNHKVPGSGNFPLKIHFPKNLFPILHQDCAESDSMQQNESFKNSHPIPQRDSIPRPLTPQAEMMPLKQHAAKPS